MPFTFYYDMSKSEDLDFFLVVSSMLCLSHFLKGRNPSINSIIWKNTNSCH